MESGEKRALIKNSRSFLNSAEIVYKTGDFTSAAILYFKTFFAVLDILILDKTGKTPKDHSERFRILESGFPELYLVLDKFYPNYRNTYTSVINKEECDLIKENVKGIIERYKLFENN